MSEKPDVTALLRQNLVDALVAEMPPGKTLADCEALADEMVALAERTAADLRADRAVVVPTTEEKRPTCFVCGHASTVHPPSGNPCGYFGCPCRQPQRGVVVPTGEEI